MTTQSDIKKLAQQMAGSMKSWEHPTFCVIIDESHIAVTQNIGCSLINLFKADSQFQMDIDHCFFGQLDNVCTARLIYFADAENITVAWYFFDRFSL